MASNFFFAAISICIFEGISGLLLNICLLYSLWKKTRSEYFFRIPIGVSAAHGTILNILLICFSPCHIFRDGTFIFPFFGPLSTLIPRSTCDVIMVIFCAVSTMMWTLIPATALLQYIALSSIDWGKARRLVVAYAFTVACFIENVVLLPAFIPTAAFHSKMAKLIREMFQLNESVPMVLYGSSIKDVEINDGRSLAFPLITLVMAPYNGSYALFGALVLQIRRKLVRFGAAQSQKTMRTQRAVYVMQILQGFLPLAIISVPISIFVISPLFQIDMGNATLIFTIFVWACPSVQAFVQLRFIHQSSSKFPQPTKVISTK